MGGLGHLAVKLAHAMGAHVTVLSQTLSKHDDGLRYGADAVRTGVGVWRGARSRSVTG
jgi:D-arabinose 1-dehydrogenase-like Zn-dependent alcohol dehydrogenase